MSRPQAHSKPRKPEGSAKMNRYKVNLIFLEIKFISETIFGNLKHSKNPLHCVFNIFYYQNFEYNRSQTCSFRELNCELALDEF